MLQEQLQKLGSTSHAFLIFGDREKNKEEIFTYIDSLDIDRFQNPDIFEIQAKQLGIKQVRHITDIVSRTNISLPRKFLIISADSITVESQNALLKTIEEPDAPAVFFIVVTRGSFILETIRSRVQIIEHQQDNDNGIIIKNFLQSSFAERVKLLDIFYDYEDPKKPVLIKGRISLFFDELQTELSKLVQNGKIEPQVFHDVSDILVYVLDRSANTKQIIEYISLRIPVLK